MAKAKVLDKGRHYGHVIGGAARFEQDGVLFDASGKEWRETQQELTATDGDDPRLIQALQEIERLSGLLAEAQETLLSDNNVLDDENSGFADPPQTEVDAQLEAQQSVL